MAVLLLLLQLLVRRALASRRVRCAAQLVRSSSSCYRSYFSSWLWRAAASLTSTGTPLRCTPALVAVTTGVVMVVVVEEEEQEDVLLLLLLVLLLVPSRSSTRGCRPASDDHSCPLHT